jgi:hypothetical protein
MLAKPRVPISRVLCEKWGFWIDGGLSTQACFRLGSLFSSQHKEQTRLTVPTHSIQDALPDEGPAANGKVALAR